MRPVVGRVIAQISVVFAVVLICSVLSFALRSPDWYDQGYFGQIIPNIGTILIAPILGSSIPAIWRRRVDFSRRLSATAAGPVLAIVVHPLAYFIAYRAIYVEYGRASTALAALALAVLVSILGGFAFAWVVARPSRLPA